MGSIPATAPYPASTRLHLRLLGRFELSSAHCPLQARPSGERLLAYLAVTPGPVARQETAAALWPDCTEVRAAANLRSVLWRLPGRPQGGVVTSSAAGLSLMPGLGVDIDEIAGELAGDLAVEEPVSISTLRQDVLPGWPEHWLVPTREWFRQARLRALEALCDRHRAAGRTGPALDAALAAVGCDPLRESAHRRLALIHISDGNLAEALRQYHVYRQLARSELGLPPSAQFRQIVAPLLGRPADLGAG
jgi:DNA-binding SARP family transcriptional activator